MVELRCHFCETEWDSEGRSNTVVCPNCRHAIWRVTARRNWLNAHDIPQPARKMQVKGKNRMAMLERYQRAQSLIAFCREEEITPKQLSHFLCRIKREIYVELIGRGLDSKEALIQAEERVTGHAPTVFTVEI